MTMDERDQLFDNLNAARAALCVERDIVFQQVKVDDKPPNTSLPLTISCFVLADEAAVKRGASIQFQFKDDKPIALPSANRLPERDD